MDEPAYVVRGYRGGKPVFYEIDSSSGYPFASTWSGKTTRDISQAISWLKECSPNSSYVAMDNAQVCKIEYVPVDITEQVKKRDILEEYVKNLSDSDRKLLKGLL